MDKTLMQKNIITYLANRFNDIVEDVKLHLYLLSVYVAAGLIRMSRWTVKSLSSIYVHKEHRSHFTSR